MAGLIPQPFIDELIARSDIVDVIGSRLDLKKAGANYQALCPFHSEKTPSFTVSPSKQFYHCFGCGANGTALRFLMEYDRLEFPEAVEVLARQLGMEIPREARPREAHDSGDLYDALAEADKLYRNWLRRHPQRQRAIDYLRGRGLSGEIAADYGIGFAPPGWDNLLKSLEHLAGPLHKSGMLISRDNGGQYDRFRDRIMFPIRDRRGRVIAFGGRVLDNGEPKYLNSPETPVFHKGRELYGLHECLQAQRKPADILVVEGYMDVVALAQHGFRNAVATLGTATSTQHVERLFQTTTDVVFCFDGDRAGRQAAWRALESALPAMRDRRQARFLFLPDGEDPDTLVRHSRDAFVELLGDALPLSEFLFRELAGESDLKSMDGRARIAETAAPLIARIPPGVFRDLMIDELSSLAKVDRAHVEAVMAGDKPTTPAEKAPARPARVKTQRRTLIRVAVALLLERPTLAESALPPELVAQLSLPGADLLAEIIEILQQEPHLSSGALLERFRDSPHEAALWKLATWDHMTPSDGVEAEFVGAMEHLETLLARQRLQYLQGQLEKGNLTPEEHQEWLALLKAKGMSR